MTSPTSRKTAIHQSEVQCRADDPVTHVAMSAEFGWRRAEQGKLTIWTKGYGSGADAGKVAKVLSRLNMTATPAEIESCLIKFDGHFALIVEGSGWAVAAVDRVRSIPLAFAKGAAGWTVDDQAERLKASLGLVNVDPNTVLPLAMAGYTIDNTTLYRGIQQLGPGEFVVFEPHGQARRGRYYMYRPWRADKPRYNARKARQKLAETTLELIDGMMKGIGDRLLIVPLSAGRDSRLIVSAAKHLGYRNIRTFAYGRKGNHEAKASQAIAKRLGYEWRFIPTDTGFMRDYFASEDWRGYQRFADTLQSVPFVQDMPQIQVLKRNGYIPEDAVFCNGNSGDFISGNHIVPPVDEIPKGLDRPARLNRIIETLYSKHFGLWDALRTEANKDIIANQLTASIERVGAELGDAADDYGIYEYAEFQDRQSKYVISGQRIYEFLGHEWRLPLWDRAYLDFFERVPLEGKRGQKLYADMLENENWGGVWRDLPVNAETVRPHWIRPLRLIAKAAHTAAGPEAWHRFERKYFQYWMTGGSQSAIRCYGSVVRDQRGARNAVAWLTEDYLNRHGLQLGKTGLAQLSPGKK